MVIPALSTQVVLITGASSGIGAAIALDLSLKYPGIKLVLAARNQDKLETIATQSRQRGAEVLVIQPLLMSQRWTRALARWARNPIASPKLLPKLWPVLNPSLGM